MSSCQHTTLIPSNQCIGDSLRTINTNFTVLNNELCKIPKVAGNNKTTNVEHKMDLLGCNEIVVDTEPTPKFFKNFDSVTSEITKTTYTSEDGLQSTFYNFPYISSSRDPKPIGAFDDVTGNGIPQITLYWMSSANNSETVFALNSSVSFVEKGLVSPDGPVHCFCEHDGKLHIGGAFNNIGVTTTQKFATINLAGGALDNELGQVGELTTSLLASVPNHTTLFGQRGFINFIKKSSVFLTSTDQRTVFAIGGNYRSDSNGGRSLVIWDDTTKTLYPFYVNGSVFNCVTVGTDLYVVGQFDFANFGLEPETLKSGKRSYSKSILKISLIKLLTGQQHSAVDIGFCANVREQLTNVCEINCIESTGNQLFVGGEFVAETNGLPTQRNLLALSFTGEIIESIKLIVNKPVKTMIHDADLSVLYIGGEFTTIIQQSEFFDELNQPPKQTENEYFRAAAFDVQIEQAPVLLEYWRPKFNNTVTKLEIHNESISSNIYAMGEFTQVNSERAGHLVAIYKATDPSVANQIGQRVNWEAETPTAPTKYTNGLLKSERGIYVGGLFTRINGGARYYFSEITGVGERPSKTISEVVWDVGGKVLTSGEQYSLNPINGFTVRAKTICKQLGTVNSTTFPPLVDAFQNQRAGHLCRFFIRRPCFSTKLGNLDVTDDTYNGIVHVIGWSVSYI
jgi:hypothetical protein